MTVTENNNSHSSLEATRSLLTTQQSTETSRSSIDDKTLLNQGSIPRIRSSNRISFVGDENDTLRYANDKKNQDFHLLFKSIPEQDRLLEDYGCALQKEILLQGRVYFTHHNICFNSNIFGWITSLIISFADVQDIEKKSTAIFIPNAILISTTTTKYFFASFLSRDQAYDQLIELWKASQLFSTVPHKDNDTLLTDDSYSCSSSPFSEEESVILINTCNFEERQISLASLPVTAHSRSSRSEALRRRAVSEAGPRPALNNYTIQHKRRRYEQQRERTECDCSKNDQHFPKVVMDTIYSTDIETIYNLLYNSNFMQHFLSDIEKSTEICIGPWAKLETGDVEYSRESSFIKQLGGVIGPKSTKCYLKEDMIHLDVNNYVSQMTVTQTPDVPSGGSFHVKTRTCISYVAQRQVRVLVTVLVEFTKSSWLKSTIEKATIEGQENYYKNLDAAINRYLDRQRNKGSKTKKNRSKKLSKRSIKSVVGSDKKGISFRLNTMHIMIISLSVILVINIFLAVKITRLNQRMKRLEDLDYKSAQDDWIPSKSDLAQQMIELEQIINRTSQDIQQISNAAKYQRERTNIQ